MGYSAHSTSVRRQITQHPADGDTISAWTLDGVNTDSVGPNNIAGTPAWFRIHGLDVNDLLCMRTTQANSGSTGLKLYGAVTVAAWFLPMVAAAGNLAIVGLRGTGGAEADNYPWTLDYQNDRRTRMYWQYGAKLESIVQGATSLTLGEWVHVIGTRNAAGTAGAVYLNGVSDGTAAGLNAPTGGTTQNNVRFLHNGAGSGITGGLASVIVKDVEVDATAAMALYRSALTTG